MPAINGLHCIDPGDGTVRRKAHPHFRIGGMGQRRTVAANGLLGLSSHDDAGGAEADPSIRSAPKPKPTAPRTILEARIGTRVLAHITDEVLPSPGRTGLRVYRWQRKLIVPTDALSEGQHHVRICIHHPCSTIESSRNEHVI